MRNILLVDDLQENLNILEDLINENFDINIYKARSGLEALEFLSENPVDLIITDVQMPNMDGFTFVEMLKKRKFTANIPVIFITANFNAENYKQRGFDMGALDYITKPIDEAVLTGKLQRYFEIFSLQKKLKRQTNYLHRIFDAQEAITLLSTGKELKFVNQRFFEVFGFGSLEEFQERYTCVCELFVNKPDRPSLKTQIDGIWWTEYVLKNPDKTHEAYMFDKEGEERVFKVSIAVIKDDHERYPEYIISLSDITLIKQQSHMIQLQSKHSTMGEMISMIAHQWRQPLSTLGTIIANIRMKQELGRLDDEKLLNSLKSCDNLIGHMGSTIDDFRNFFRKSDERTTQLISSIVEGPKHLVEAMFKEHRVEFHVNYDTPENIKVFAEHSLLRQVVLNIYKNSIDAFENSNKQTELAPRYISVYINQDSEYINIEICDNAGGIEKNHLEKVFEPYFSTKNKNGTGLGLYMVKTIIEDKIQGAVEVYNKEKGACFVLKLPNKLIVQRKDKSDD